MTTKIILLTCTLSLAFWDSDAVAYTEKGFMVGGGVGAVSCPDFLDAMATARQSGGVTTNAGANVINPYLQYVVGFQTGYNFAADGVFDVFGSLGKDPAIKVLFAIEPWCAKHPEEHFADALLDLLKTLGENATEPH
jgi:hypothetical protein